MGLSARAGSVVPAAVLALAVALTACDSQNEEIAACDLLDRAVVARQLETVSGHPPRVRRERSESLDQSVCRYAGPGTNVGLNVDSAPEARRRYFNRVTEALQFSVHDPGQRPQPVSGLGDDDALGPAGAYWIPSYRQLFVLRGSRQFIYQFSVRGTGARAARRAAVRIAAATLPGERTVGREGTTGKPGRLELVVAAPDTGAVVRSRSVVVRGTVSGAAPTVQVQGRDAPVSAGTFALTVPLRRGPNRVRITVSSRNGERITRSLTVRRGRPPAAVGAAFARRHPGRMPDVLAQPLPDARALLQGARIPYRVVRLTDERLPQRSFTVCSTDPAAGQRLARSAQVVLKVDAADPFRTSGTSCARE